MVQRYEQMRRLQWYKCGAAYLESVKSGEEWVKSRYKLFTSRNADKHRGFRRKGEE